MAKNLLKRWMEENYIGNEGLPETWDEMSTLMRKDFTPLDALSIDELETFIENDSNKVYIASYANCLLDARKTGKYFEVNRFRYKIGMAELP